MGLRVFLIPFCFDCPYFGFFSQLQKEKSTIAVKGSPWNAVVITLYGLGLVVLRLRLGLMGELSLFEL